MNKKAVSAVIGVILMVAITVAIAGTVYFYITNEIMQETNDAELIMEGWVIKAQSTEYNISINDVNYTIWKLNMGVNYDTDIGDTNVNYVIFTNDMSAPPDGVKLRLYHTVIIHETLGVVFNINRVVSL